MTTFIEREQQYLFQTYKRLNLDIERGEGVYLYTKDGRKYLDMFSGLAVNALGYNHPAVISAIQSQITKYLHLSNTFYQDKQIELAGRIILASGFDKLFFSNSGTEAMEGALKLARRWGRSQGKTMIYGLSGSFHGRTFGSLSITGRDKYRDGFEPFLPNTGLLKFNNIGELEKAVNENTLAVVLEFIQGEGGVNPVSSAYANALSELRKRHGFLIIADEIQAGVGRTGKFFGFQHFNVEPDIVVMAKAIGGGLPLGAFLTKDHLAAILTQGVHGTTFGGNPVACAAGIATLREVTDNGVMENARLVGGYLAEKLNHLKSMYPECIVDVRGFGLMVGTELAFEGSRVVEGMLEDGVLLNLTNTNVLRWLPPLIVEKSHIDAAVGALERTIREVKTGKSKG